jgi:hypothetical protein
MTSPAAYFGRYAIRAQIFWNGGDDSGVIGLGSYRGAYLTASSTFFRSDVPNAAQYGIFVSSANGPGTIELAYVSNMADASFYVGACADCNAVLRFLHGVRHRSELVRSAAVPMPRILGLHALPPSAKIAASPL